MRDTYYFHTEGLTVGYHGVPLIRDIELSLRKGEILTLIGPNGAGKTTILKSIIRQLSPVGGLVYLDGKEMGELSGKELSTKLSVVLTDRVRPELMTCEDVVATGRYPYTGRFGILSEEDHRIVKESMELVHIEELADRDFLKTSDGQKQRIMLARAICQEPDIIVLDEPTSFLDMRYKLEFLSIIQKMSRQKNLSVIMSLHELDLAGRISDKIACVRGDKIDRFGTPEEIFSEGYVPKLYQMTTGSYDERTGNLELEKVEGEPQVLVLAGNGTGTALFRKLQREGIPFAAGILWENDLDYPSAKALAAEVVSVKAFHRISDEQGNRVKELAKCCEKVICTLNLDKLREADPELAGWYQACLEEKTAI
jgi:iron complex transport system ATP-binding protein